MEERPGYDLWALADVMHDDQTSAYVDPTTRQVYSGYYGEIFDDAGDVLDEVPEEWLPVDTVGSRVAYQDMVDFAYALSDRLRRERLLGALEGRGAFRRFRDVVHQDDLGLGRIWTRFSDATRELRAIEWLVDEELLTEPEAAAESEPRETLLREIRQELAGMADADLAAVKDLERELRAPDLDRDRMSALLADDFEEIDAVGRLRDSEARLLDVQPDGGPAEMHDLTARHLGDDLVLVRWTAPQGVDRAVRTSLWRRELEGWKLVHHQATPLP